MPLNADTRNVGKMENRNGTKATHQERKAERERLLAGRSSAGKGLGKQAVTDL